MSVRRVTNWQGRFYSGRCVYATVLMIDGIEEVSNYYETEEAAQLEVGWARRLSSTHRIRVPAVRKIHLHSLDLSRDRWGEPAPIPHDVAQARLREANDVRIKQLEGGA